MAKLKTLRRGSRGPQTQFLQLALTRAGYALETDGVFGPATERAVRAFQDSSGLISDGIVGKNTWSALTPYLTGYIIHTVKSGDTFYKIAAAHGTTAEAIAAANPDADPQNLQIGSRITVPLGFPVVPTDIAFTSTVLEYSLRGLAARYPFIRVGEAGKSVIGESLRTAVIGRGRRQAFYNASHHANEWITTPLLMKFLEEYAESYASGGSIGSADAGDLFDRTTLYMMPMVNPDGVDLVTGELDSGEYYDRAAGIAADYPGIPFPSGWKANIEGTDLNLQYPAGWERAREIKYAQGFTSPAPRDFVGSAPLSAPESRAVYAYTNGKDFGLTISYHTQGEVIYWRYLDLEPENAYEIAKVFSALSGYEIADVPYDSGFAGYKDWFILSRMRPGYTIEAGSGTAPLPTSQFETIYNDNVGILAAGLQYA